MQASKLRHPRRQQRGAPSQHADVDSIDADLEIDCIANGADRRTGDYERRFPSGSSADAEGHGYRPFFQERHHVDRLEGLSLCYQLARAHIRNDALVLDVEGGASSLFISSSCHSNLLLSIQRQHEKRTRNAAIPRGFTRTSYSQVQAKEPLPLGRFAPLLPDIILFLYRTPTKSYFINALTISDNIIYYCFSSYSSCSFSASLDSLTEARPSGIERPLLSGG